MSLTLYGRRTSVNVQKVMWALGELGLAHEQVEMGGKFGGLDAPEFRRMNPNGFVPVLKDGDFILWESHAIVRYLAARHGSGTLWPTGLEERARADQWTDWTSAQFQPAWIGVFSAMVRTRPQDRDSGLIARRIAAAEECFAVLNAQLARTLFLTGDILTFADIVAGAGLFRWYSMEIERRRFAAVEAWHQRLLARPAFVSGVCVSYEDLVAR